MKPVKWEYKIEALYGFGINEKEVELNVFGEDGWELCGFLTSHKEEHMMIWKRRKP